MESLLALKEQLDPLVKAHYADLIGGWIAASGLHLLQRTTLEKKLAGITV